MSEPQSANQKRGFWNRILPALTLVFLSPMLGEVLPGATRFSSIFVFPIEMTVWGGGALMIRELVRRYTLGWANMLALALCLAIAEEWLIQQTSLAPLVVQIQGVEYGRAFGINHVYFIWAAMYEAVLVVFLPVMLAEMLFPARRRDPWMSRAGWIVAILLFAIGSFLAWFTWTQIARTQVFHLPQYDPPLAYVALALGTIAALMLFALGPWRQQVARIGWTLRPPAPWLLALGGAVWAVLWFGLEILAFGAKPDFPPLAASGLGLALAAAIKLLMPGFASHPDWSDRHRAWLIAGTMIATMGIFFYAGFTPGTADFWFKAGTNAVAAILFVLLVSRYARAAPPRRS